MVGPRLFHHPVLLAYTLSGFHEEREAKASPHLRPHRGRRPLPLEEGNRSRATAGEGEEPWQSQMKTAVDGIRVTYGVSAGADVTFSARDFFRIGGTKLYSFILFHEIKAYPASEGLARLA